MKKLALAVIATAFIAISHSPVSAQTPDPTVVPGVTLPLPVECDERDGGSPVDDQGRPNSPACVDFYLTVGQAPPVIQQVPPVVTTTTVVLATGPLPRTGSSVSPLLGLGGALLVGGGIIVVATRRRSTATAS